MKTKFDLKTILIFKKNVNSNLKLSILVLLGFIILTLVFCLFLTFSLGHKTDELKIIGRNSNLSKLSEFNNLGCVSSYDNDLDTLLNGYQSPKKFVKCNEDPIEFSINGSIVFKEKFNIEICLHANVIFNAHSGYNISDYQEIKPGVFLDDRYEFYHFKCRTRFWEYYSFLARVLKKTEEDPMDLKLNVFMIVLSSLSQERWISELPRSTEFFIKRMKGKVLKQFNSIDDRPFKSFVPLTTSYLYDEIIKDPNYFKKDFPFIWKEFSKGLGFRTLFAEDMLENDISSSNIGLKRSPTSHYFRPFLNSIKRLTNNKLCVGSLGLGKIMLDYGTSFMKANRNTGFFGLLYLTGYSYESSNVNLLDDELYDFLHSFRHDKLLKDRTVFILVSEQGASNQKHVSDSLKERNPFAAIYLPKLFKQKYTYEYLNFLDNINKLTTPMDIHRTLIDIVSLEQMAKLSPKNDLRSLSLFGKIPSSRSCYDAGIDQKFCGCLSKESPHNNSTFIFIAQEFIQFLNREIEKIPNSACLKHEFKRILDVLVFDDVDQSSLSPSSAAIKSKNKKKYYFKIETSHKIIYEFTTVDKENTSSDKQDFDFDLNSVNRLTETSSHNKCIEQIHQNYINICICEF
ncbi:unnamed protein product [Brachionus calyciflorus]|uniref:Uncharacterized protein n=1 Tax=Brachionus calyciflorus TaxID=104777 RepID=A0A813PGV7_9BILA|nr:unnamed protein product [Brachionus calyciflorus]